MKVPAAVFRYVEHELYNYDRSQREILELREDIIEGQVICEVKVSGGETSDLTRSKAERLITNKAIARMTRVTMSIGHALARLGEDHRQLYELKYRQGRPWEWVCDEIPVSRSTYFRMRKEIIELVAFDLGLIT